MFDNKYYFQTQGTSMWSLFAPNYASLFMGLWEGTLMTFLWDLQVLKVNQ